MVAKGESNSVANSSMKDSRSRKNRRLEDEELEQGIAETYLCLLRILKLPAVRIFCLVLLTCKMGFAATDAVTGLKLMENGVHKEHLAMLAIPLVPLQIILPWVISKYTAGPRPLDVFLKAYPFRLGFGVLFAGLLWWTKMLHVQGALPFYYFAVITVAYAAHQITVYSIYVALMGFHAKVSDPAIGGTYMTLLNTLTNLGGNWPATLSLYLVEYFDVRHAASSTSSEGEVKSSGEVWIDGYYVETLICILIGFVWLKWGRSKVNRLSSLPPSAWRVVK